MEEAILNPHEPGGTTVGVSEDDPSLSLKAGEEYNNSVENPKDDGSPAASSNTNQSETDNLIDRHIESRTNQEVNVSNDIESDVNLDSQLHSLVARDDGLDGQICMRRQNSLVNSTGSYFKTLGDIKIRDHFSLSEPSSHLPFNDHETVVFHHNLEQLTFEKNNDNVITAKQSTTASPGLLALRMIYTLMAFLLAGFLFVFSTLTVLFLFLGILIGFGISSSQGFNSGAFLGTLTSFPLIITGLSTIMVLAQTFVLDTWKGFSFLNSVTRWDSIHIDWISFSTFLVIPTFVGTITLMSGNPNWWEITIMSWLVVVSILYAAFSISVLWHEVKACFDLVRSHPKLRNGDDPNGDEKAIVTFSRLCLLRLKQKMSVYERVEYIAQGCDPHPDELTYAEIKEKEEVAFSIDWFSFSPLAQLSCMKRFYTTLDEPIRQESVGKITDHTTYVTKSSWGLESIFCRNQSARYVALIDGPSALTKKQASSSLVCFGLGIIMVLLTILSILLFLVREVLSPLMIAVVIVLFFVIHGLIFYKPIRNMMKVVAEYRVVLMREDGKLRSITWNSKSNSFWKVNELFRISEPTTSWISWVVMGIIAVVFGVFPIASSFASGNTPIGLLLLLLAFLAVTKDICSLPDCLGELGSLDNVKVNTNHDRNRAEWREKHRLGKILRETSFGSRSKFWNAFFMVFMLCFANFIALAAIRGTEDVDSSGLLMASGQEFEYKSSKFDTCALPGVFKSPEADESALIDLVFLARMAEFQDDVAEGLMAEWFKGNSVVLSDKKNTFQKEYRDKNVNSALTYKLIDLPDSNLKIIPIRGSKSLWDWLHDAQIWFPVIFFQLFRLTIPFGNFLNPVLPHLIKGVSSIEAKALEDASYYKEISSFVEILQEEQFDVQIVGHSLGGGVAMISGAQRQVPSLAISGPNSVLSHLTFDPVLNVDDLAKYTFNIVPEKDPVPLIDELSDNFKQTKCRQKVNDFRRVCHLIRNTLCEVLITCGSKNRPIPCECVHEFGHDPPESIYGMEFSEACPLAQ